MNYLCALFLILFSCDSSSVTLESYLDLVKQENLDFKLKEFELEGTRVDAEGMRLPPPTVGVISQNFRDGTSAKGLSADLMLPNPLKISLDKDLRKEVYQNQKIRTSQNKNEILMNARNLFINYQAQSEILKTLFEKEKNYKDHLALSKALTRSDNLLQIHLLKFEGDLDLLQNKILRQKEKLTGLRLELLSLINKKENFSLGKIPPLKMTKLDSFSFKDSYMIRDLRAKLKVSKINRDLNDSLNYPDFNLSYMRMEKSMMMPAYDQIAIGITLPFIFGNENHSKKQMAEVKFKSAKISLKEKENSLNLLEANLKNKLESLKNELKRIDHELIPRANKRMSLMKTIAPRDMASLLDHFDTMDMLPNLKIERTKILSEYENIVSFIYSVTNSEQAK